MKTLSVLLIALLLAGCGASAEQIAATEDAAQAQTETAAPTLTLAPTLTPTLTPTITPTSTPVFTPTPEFTNVYESKKQGVSIRYPSDWNVSESGDEIIIENNGKWISLYFHPSGAQREHNNDPVAALVSYINFVGYVEPNKERVHLVNLNDSEFAFGSYSNPGEDPGLFYSPNPMFMAMRFTNNHTVAIEFHAPPGEEEKNRDVLELIIASLPPSPPRTVIATPTLAPNATVDLPTPPEGFNWQGVTNINLALLVPDDWFVVFFNRGETWQSGLQEYNYQYTITQENPYHTGTFSPVPGIMRVWALKSSSINVSSFANEMHQDLKTYPTNKTRVIEEQVNEHGKNIIYKLHAERINPNSNITQGDAGYNQTFISITIANRETKTLYVLHFESATDTWEQEWETGQIMMQLMQELLMN